jgi:lantibiotic leader peptide-processing serine protease
MKLLAQAVTAALCMLGMAASAQAASFVVQTQGNGFGARLAQRIEAAGGRVTVHLPQIGVAIVESDDPAFAARAAAIGGIRSVAEDRVVQFQQPEEVALDEAAFANPPFAVGGDPYFNLQWGHAAVDAAGAWNAGQFGAGATVAVLDSGTRCNHPDLAPNLLLDKAASFVPGQTACNPAVLGQSSHGSHVAGTIAAAMNGVGTVGIAPQAKIIPVKVLSSTTGGGSFAGIIQGIVYATDAGANVINMSLGVSNGLAIGGKDVAELVNATARATRYARAQGALVVVAAGNDGMDLDHSSGLEGCTQAGDCSRYNLRSFPSELPGVLSIAATAPIGWAKAPATAFLDYPASYTNFGRSAIDLSAPGGDYSYPGNEACAVVVVNACWVFDMVLSTSMTGWTWMAGTSMAAPHVSGVAALVYAKHGGNISPAQVESILRRSADHPGQGGQDPFYGHGRVNAARAVAL